MFSHEQRFAGGSRRFLAFVFSERGQSVSPSAGEENFLSAFQIRVLALPSFQNGSLQRASVRERQRPRLLSFVLVDGVQIDAGVHFRLTSGQEDDSGHSSGQSTLQSGHRSASDLLRADLLRARLSGRDHVRLQQRPLQIDVVIGQRFVNVRQHLFGHLLTTVQIVVAVLQHFRLNDRDQFIRLTNGSVTSQNVSVLQHGQMRRRMLSDGQHATPFSETTPAVVIFFATFGQFVQTLSGSLADGSGQRDDAGVDFYAGNNAVLLDRKSVV